MKPNNRIRKWDGLTRAKDKETGKWRYGHYVPLCVGSKRESYRIYTGYAKHDCDELFPDWYEIDPATLCRCTGYIDKNGKWVYEGDIVRCKALDKFYWAEQPLVGAVHFGEYHTNATPAYTSVGFYLKWSGANALVINDSKFVDFGFCFAEDGEKEMTVIGNIFDNPNLLKNQ